MPNRDGLRLAPAGIIAIPTIQELDPNGFLATDADGNLIRADAVVLPTTTALMLDGSGDPVLDPITGQTIPIRAMFGFDENGVRVEIVDPAAQFAIRSSPLSGAIEMSTIGCVSGHAGLRWRKDSNPDNARRTRNADIPCLGAGR